MASVSKRQFQIEKLEERVVPAIVAAVFTQAFQTTLSVSGTQTVQSQFATISTGGQLSVSVGIARAAAVVVVTP